MGEEAGGVLGDTDNDILDRLDDQDDNKLNNIHELAGQPRQYVKHWNVAAAVVNNRADNKNSGNDQENDQDLYVAFNVDLVQPANVMTWRKVNVELGDVNVAFGEVGENETRVGHLDLGRCYLLLVVKIWEQRSGLTCWSCWSCWLL